MPYALKKVPGGYFVETKSTYKRHSKKPLSHAKAVGQMRAMSMHLTAAEKAANFREDTMTPYELGAQYAIKLASLEGFGDVVTPIAGALMPVVPTGVISGLTAPSGQRMHAGIGAAGGQLGGGLVGGIGGAVGGGLTGAGLGALIQALRGEDIGPGVMTGGTIGGVAGGLLGGVGGGAYGAHAGRQWGLRA